MAGLKSSLCIQAYAHPLSRFSPCLVHTEGLMVLVFISAQGPEKLVLIIYAASQGPWEPCASFSALYELASLVYIPCCCQRQEGVPVSHLLARVTWDPSEALGSDCVPSVGRGVSGWLNGWKAAAESCHLMGVFPAVCLRRRGSCPGRQLGCAGHARSDVVRPLATQLSPAPITKGVKPCQHSRSWEGHFNYSNVICLGPSGEYSHWLQNWLKGICARAGEGR